MADFEFCSPPGERPSVICLVATELRSGRNIRLWEDEIVELRHPPYPTDETALFVAYFASAELNCHLALDWPMPTYVLDLYCEFRVCTNGLKLPCGAGLLGALMWFGEDGIEAAEKETMRALAQRGGPWIALERQALLDYCASDVSALARLLRAMAPELDIPRALLRGRYMKAVARMEHTGIPIDIESLERLRCYWEPLQDRLIAEINSGYGVYEGRRFKTSRFADYLIANKIPWPRLPSGGLDLKDDTFREMVRTYPAIAPLRELRVALSQMRLSELAVGSDGRNRCLLSPFRARTGRNQPSNSRFIFGPSVWLRSLVKPRPGHSIGYVDYAQQEFGIAAALSGDRRMREAYLSGDPYLAFAVQAGAAPVNATKETHKAVRDQFKSCVLAVQYGMGAESLAKRINRPTVLARRLLRLHRETYRDFWAWSDAAVDFAMLRGRLHSVFGWTVHISDNANPRFLRNFPMQANGAEMLRLACIMLTEAGITVCAPVHDAVLVEAPCSVFPEIIRKTQQIMADASAIVLGGFRLRSDAETFEYPARYRDPRGSEMWRVVQKHLSEIGGGNRHRGLQSVNDMRATGIGQ